MSSYKAGMCKLVHGIVSVDPPTIRCDGCGHEATGARLGFLVVSCGIEFNPVEHQTGRDTRRLCRTCRKDAGWDE